MFTGIIEEIGSVERITRGAQSARLALSARHVLHGTRIGDSIAVSGVCLTVTSLTDHGFTADVMHETLDRCILSRLSTGDRVNLERAMAVNGRFGGHIVSGHVDGMGTVTAIRRDDNAIWYTVAASPTILRYIIEKGSIALDGISLTVAKVTDDSFSVCAIPHSVENTTLRLRRRGDAVNLENDVIGKYVEKMLAVSTPAPSQAAQHITREFLTRHGYEGGTHDVHI